MSFSLVKRIPEYEGGQCPSAFMDENNSISWNGNNWLVWMNPNKTYCRYPDDKVCPPISGIPGVPSWSYPDMPYGAPWVNCGYEYKNVKSTADIKTLQENFSDTWDLTWKDAEGNKQNIQLETNPGTLDEVMSEYCGELGGNCPAGYWSGKDLKCPRWLSTDDNGRLCRQWAFRKTKAGSGSTVGTAYKNFCSKSENADRSECLCVNADLDPDFQKLTGNGSLDLTKNPIGCWWKPCAGINNNTLVPPDVVAGPGDCVSDICGNVINFWDNKGIEVNWNNVALKSACIKGSPGSSAALSTAKPFNLVWLVVVGIFFVVLLSVLAYKAVSPGS